jgi:hypothetical protein
MDHHPAMRHQTTRRIRLVRLRTRDTLLTYGETLRNWRPPRAAYLAPLTFGVLGLVIAVSMHGDTNPLTSVGLVMFSISIPAAGLIALNRLLNNVDEVPPAGANSDDDTWGQRS